MSSCWWFGINNAPISKASGHVKYQEIEPLLTGDVSFFVWLMDGSSTGSDKTYARMLAGDQVVFWMGDGPVCKEWGIIGFARIRQVDHAKRCCVLEGGMKAAFSVTPYPSKQPMLTEDAQFLLNLLGISYRPLRKLATRLGYEGVKPCIVTVDEVSSIQYEALLHRTRFAATSDHGDTDSPIDDLLTEGRAARRTVNAYERNAEARRRCIEAHGTSCCICGFNFAMEYGCEAEGYIHIHHLRPIAQGGGESVVDPVVDLRPVCPNCHAVIHLGGGCRSIEEVQQLRAGQRSR